MNFDPSPLFPSRIRLAFSLLFAIVLTVLSGSLRSDAKPGPRSQAAPHAAVSATVLHAFDSNAEGNAPEYGLVQGPDGTLYGVTTQTSGSGNVGIVYKVNPDGTGFAVLHSFDGGNDGGLPSAKLLLDGALLLGVCNTGGGDNEAGTVFVIDPSQVSAGNNAAGFSVLHYFQETVAPFSPGVSQLVSNPNDGSQPNGSLFLASDGSVYGTTYGPEANQTGGTIFRIQPDSSGHFSITAPTGGANNEVYSFGGSYATIYNFNGGVLTPSPTNGANPSGGVIQLSDGFLYGATSLGGSAAGISGSTVNSGYGTVYKIATDGSGFTILHSFTGGIVSGSSGITSVGDGQLPECDLIQGADGNLYGTTYYGGPGNAGTVFQIKPDSSGGFSANSPFGTIAALNNNTGNDIAGGVIQASDGNLYGTTLTGGASGTGNGSIFQIMPNPTTGKFDAVADPLVYGQTFPCPFSTIYTFLGLSNPQNVACPLIQGLDGRLYGDSLAGGQLANGTDAGGTVFAISAGLPAPVVPIVVTNVTGSLNPPEVTTASQDAVLVIHGKNFNGGDVVSIDGQNALVTGRNYQTATDEQITVTLSAPLSAGSHTATVADIPADGTRVSNAFSFTVTLLSPQITQVTNAAGGQVTSIDTTLIITGNSFASNDSINLSSVYVGTTLSLTVNNGGKMTLTLSQGLPPGGENITVTHAAPDGRASNVYNLTVQTGPAPAITSVTGTLSPPAVTTNDTGLAIHGTGFAVTDTLVIPDLPQGDSVQMGAVTADPNNPGGEQIAATLSQTLPAGTYHATVTHAAPDGRSSTAFAFTVAAAAPPVITSAGYAAANGQGVVTINGTGFASGAQVALLTPNGAIGPFTTNGGSPLTVTLPNPLPAGISVVYVTNPDGQQGNAALYVLSITGLTYDQSNPSGPLVTLTGAGIAPGATVKIEDASTGSLAGANGSVINPPTISADGTSISFNLTAALAAAHDLFVVTNPDGQTGSKDLYLAGIASVRYTVTTSGYQLVIAGAGFDPNANVTVDGAALTVAARSGETQITATGSPALTAGRHTVTVTDSDGSSGTFTITVSPPPAISVDGGTFLTNSQGSTLLVITGTNFVVNANSAVYPNFTAGATVDGTFEAATIADTGTNSDGVVVEQLFIPVGSAFGEGPHTVVVRNPDGQGSDGSIATPQARAGVKAVAQTVRPHVSTTTAQIYNSDHTSYVASLAPSTNPLSAIYQFFANLINGALHFGLSGGSNAAPTRVVPSQVGAVSNASPPLSLSTTGGGVVTGLIGQDGNGLIGQDGNGVVSNDGGSLIGQDGNGLIGQDGNGLIGQDGNGLIGQDGNGLIGQDGNGLIGHDGGSARPLDASASITVYNLFGTLDNTGSANSLDFQTASATGSVRPRATTGGAPASFAFQKSDQSGHGTGSSDFTVTGTDGSGNTITLLEMRFAPGQTDQVVYEAPGLVLTPTNGTPNPQVMNPVPTISALSASPAGLIPASTGARGAPFTLTVNGNLFAANATVSFGGQTVPTTVVSGAQLTAQIPAALIRSAGSVPVIVTNPAPGGGASSAATFTVGPQVGSAYLTTFAPGLQMISVPENYSGVSLSSSWNAPAGQLLDTWTGGPNYITGTTLPTPGQGAWIDPSANITLFDSGVPTPTAAPFPIPLQFGWNLVGNPFPANVIGSGLMVSDTQGGMHTVSQANQDGLVYTTVYTYPAGATQYQAFDIVNGTLAAYQGYWLYAFQPCTLLVAPPVNF